MLKTKKMIAIILGGIFGLLIFIPQHKLYSETTHIQSDVPNLTLVISSDKNNYLQSEPVSLNFKLSNQSDQSISWKGTLSIGRNLKILSRSKTGKEIQLDGSNSIGGIYSPLKAMESGAKVEQDILINDTLSELLFPQPDNYDLQVEFTYYTDTQEKQLVKILSNTISINISEPTGIARQAYEYIRGPLASANRQTDVQVITAREQEFVNKYRNTVYAKYVGFSLASAYQRSGEDQKAFLELCKIPNEKFHYFKDVQRKIYEIDAKLHPVNMPELRENESIPESPHPCTRVQN